MRQQGVNQFDKGLNLDTNPIAVDNHTLTGALNATMITMNGNELVLLNDMGNGRVDQAQLPKGYVPVGMQEYGGIVYVASYNPLKGESLIGCFPSPQRNLSLEDSRTPLTGLKLLTDFIEAGFIKNTTDRVLLIGENDEIIRTGDKFVITYDNNVACSYENNYNYIRLRALIINSDGTSIDISNELIDMTLKYSDVYDGSAQSPIAWETAKAIAHTPFIRILHNNSPDDTDYSIYKNKICGKLYLLAELILPAYINVSVSTETIDEDASNLKLIITPAAYNENGEEWTGNGTGNNDWRGNRLSDYDIIVTNNNVEISPENDGSYIVPKDATIEYTVYPKYNYEGTYGKVESLKRTDVINISAIGSGKVDFDDSIFRYYNNFATNKFVFDYSLKAYIDTDQNSKYIYQIDELYLELINIEDLYASSGQNLFINYDSLASYIKKINLDSSNYFGNYTKFISFENDIEKGKYYIGRINVNVKKHVANSQPSEKRYTSDWYAVITSTFTNKLYLESFDNMIIIQDNPDTTNSTPEIPATITLKVFDIDWEANITRNKIVDYSSESISSDSNATNILTEPPSDVETARIKYETVKTGSAVYKHNIETSIPTSENENYGFPFGLRFTPNNVTYNNDIKYSTEISRTGELIDETVPSVDNESIPSLEPLSGKNKVWYNVTNNNLTINYKLYSLLFSKLAKNPNATGETVNDYKFTMNTIMPAFIPYMPKHYSELGRRLLENVLGPLSSIKTNSSGALLNAEISEIYPQYWFNYALNCRKWWGDTYGTVWHLVRADLYIGIMEGIPNLVIPIDNDSEVSLNSGTLLNINGWLKISYLAHQLKTNPAQWAIVKLNLETITSNIGSPTFLLWYGIVNDWSNLSTSGTSHGAGTSTYCIPIMLDKDGYPYILKTFYLSRKDLLVDIVRNFNSIYVQQPDLNVNYDYWIGSNEISKFVYTNNYLVNTSYNVNITTNNAYPVINDVNYNAYNTGTVIKNKVSFDDKSLYLPKFKLIDKSFDQNYTDSYSCPDLSVKNAQFLDTNVPVLDSCAIVFDGSGQRLVTEAKKVKLVPSVGDEVTRGLYELSNAKFDQPNHAYLYVRDDENGKPILIDCLDPDNALNYAYSYTLGQWGYNIAQALRNNKLQIETDNLHNRKNIVVNNTNALITSTNWWLGNAMEGKHGDWRFSRRKITDLAKDHVINLDLFKTTYTTESF